MMIKLNILNMKEFLKKVNTCIDEVKMIFPDGQKENICCNYKIQSLLNKQFETNKRKLKLILEIKNLRDYLEIISYYIGDC